MRSFLVAVGISLLVSSAASAADLAAQEIAPTEPIAAPATLWTGFYVGAHIGGSWGDENDNLSATVDPEGSLGPGLPLCPPGAPLPWPICFPVGPADDFDIHGVTGGIHTGYNWQAGSFVFGVEADADISGVDGGAGHAGVVGGFFPLPFGTALDGRLAFEQQWMASIRARLGWALGRALIYGTGGVAFSGGELGYRGEFVDGGICIPFCSSGSFSTSDDQLHLGWTVGLGGEFKFTNNWSARLEARYTDFAEETYELDVNGLDIPVDVDFDQVTVSAGVSYHF